MSSSESDISRRQRERDKERERERDKDKEKERSKNKTKHKSESEVLTYLSRLEKRLEKISAENTGLRSRVTTLETQLYHTEAALLSETEQRLSLQTQLQHALREARGEAPSTEGGGTSVSEDDAESSSWGRESGSHSSCDPQFSAMPHHKARIQQW